jgi:hypothetical protein
VQDFQSFYVFTTEMYFQHQEHEGLIEFTNRQELPIDEVFNMQLIYFQRNNYDTFHT